MRIHCLGHGYDGPPHNSPYNERGYGDDNRYKRERSPDDKYSPDRKRSRRDDYDKKGDVREVSGSVLRALHSMLML